MKLREIIKLSSIMLNLEEILASDKLYDTNYDILNEDEILLQGDDIDKTFNLLVRCFNLAYSEIATDYLSLTCVEKIKIEKERFNLTELDNKFFKLIKLEDKNGNEVKCSIYDNVLYAKDGDYKLYYCYVPAFATLNSEINSFNGKILDRIFAYGLNKEYCYISGLYEESNSYRNKFEEALKSCIVIKKNLTMPKRRWF